MATKTTKRLGILGLLLVLATAGVAAQTASDLALTFTSQTEARFFVYLNGKRQNEKSVGMLTLRHLEDKKYHVRIVIDDPFEVATTCTLRPSATRNEYAVLFNPVRERVYVKRSRQESELETTLAGSVGDASPAAVDESLNRLLRHDAEKSRTEKKASRRLRRDKDDEPQSGTTGKDIKTTRRVTVDND